jgi:hypothetical protein
MKNKGFLRLPNGIDFEVWGLSEVFVGDRTLGLWDVDGGMPTPLLESTPVYRVTTEHADRFSEGAISVVTVPKRPRSDGWSGRIGPFGYFGFRDAAGAALSEAISKAAWCEPGIEASFDVLEVLRRGDDPESLDWGRTRLVVAGADSEAHFLHVGMAWVAVVELEDVVVAVSGCRAEPGDYDLVPIVDLTAYASTPWPGRKHKKADTS